MRRRLVDLLAVSLLIACAPNFRSAPLGAYDAYRPWARLRGASIDIALSQPGHIAVIDVLAPEPGYPGHPVLFRPIYPRYSTDPTRFEPGEHRVRPRNLRLQQHANCGTMQKPSMDGCRRNERFLPGVTNISAYTRGVASEHYIVIASDGVIDPFTLSEDLFYGVLESPELTAWLTARDPRADGPLQELLARRPGPQVWSALYVSAR